MRSIATENKSYMGNGTYPAMSCYLQSSVSAWCRPSQSRNLHHCRYDQSLESSFPTSTKLTNNTLSHLQPRKEKPPNLTSTTKINNTPYGLQSPRHEPERTSPIQLHRCATLPNKTPQLSTSPSLLCETGPTGKRRIHPQPTHLTATEARARKPPPPPPQRQPHFQYLHRQANHQRAEGKAAGTRFASPSSTLRLAGYARPVCEMHDSHRCRAR